MEPTPVAVEVGAVWKVHLANGTLRPYAGDLSFVVKVGMAQKAGSIRKYPLAEAADLLLGVVILGVVKA